MRTCLATNTCAIAIDITAPDDEASWYDLWQAAVALDGLCARAGKVGKARFLGRFRILGRCFVTCVVAYGSFVQGRIGS